MTTRTVLFTAIVAGAAFAGAAPTEHIVHRCWGLLWPENSMAALERCWQAGFIPEADARISSDGMPYIYHDPTYKGRKVSQMTWAEMKAIDIGAKKGEKWKGTYPPTLDEVFAAMAGYLIFIDNPYFDEPSDVPCPAPASAAAKRNIPAGNEASSLYPGGVDIRNLRLAAAGDPAAFRFTEPAAASVKAEHAAEIPETVKHVWLFNSAGKTDTIEKPFRNALETAGIPLDQVRISVTPERGLRVNLQLTRRQCVMLTRQLAAQQFQLVSPTQPQPEQHLFAGTGEELVEYEAVLLPRG